MRVNRKNEAGSRTQLCRFIGNTKESGFMVSRLAAYAITAAVTVSQSLTYQPSYAEETAGETAATEVLQPEFDYEAIKAMMPPQQ